MKKSFRISVDCANCARKVEDSIRKVNGVISVRVNFMTLRMTLEAPDEIFDEVLKEAVAAGKKVEDEFEVRL